MKLPLDATLANIRQTLRTRSGLDAAELDRLAVALAFLPDEAEGDDASMSAGPPVAAAVDWDAVDRFDDGPIFTPLLTLLQGPCDAEGQTAGLQGLLRRGYLRLQRRFRSCGQDWTRTLAGLLERAPASMGAVGAAEGRVLPIEVEIGAPVGASQGEPISWVINREADRQNNANARLAGAPGSGKSQFLLHLLAQIADASADTGFIFFDYKGDLATNRAFVERTGATIIDAQHEPVPVNPFQLPDGMSTRLAPRGFAEVFQSVSPNIGPVQLELLTQAMEQAYDAAADGDATYPTLAQVHEAVTAIYAREGRNADSVTANLRSLAELGLFAERSQFSFGQIFGARWVIDLSGLGTLRDFVAFVLLQFLSQAVVGLADAPFDRNHKTRALRGIVAVDEAHYYLRGRCGPLLQLIRVGRSKGVPVFLSSQSLEDFRHYTELNEFLPNSFLLRHGIVQDARTVAGALGLSSMTVARRVAERAAALEQFEAFTPLTVQGEEAPAAVKLIPFFESVHP